MDGEEFFECFSFRKTFADGCYFSVNIGFTYWDVGFFNGAFDEFCID